jgi:radical SAM protein with 4Fe4S-binding SPASM domain
MLNEATKANLRRKSAFVDQAQLHGGVPLPSWIDLSLTELCNRSAGSKRPCVFCPRIDPQLYPNQALHMGLPLARKIGAELFAIGYAGAVVLCGFGEPMLHPQLEEIVRIFGREQWRLELVTNGDRLTVEVIAGLYELGVTFFVVSLYDGPHQVEPMRQRFEAAGVSAYLLRDRWHAEADSFGLKLTNRAGTVSVGDQDPVDVARPCHYPAYQMTVDWNGDVLLCPQDWHKKLKFGNLAAQPLLDVWTSPALNKRRMALIDGRRCAAPCNGCNTDGTLHGFNHVPLWRSEKADDHGSHRAREVA